MPTLSLVPGRLALSELREIWSAPVRIGIDSGARSGVDAAAAVVQTMLSSGRTVYGVNTGFGLLARTRIDTARLAELQRALVLSHSAGTGALLDDAVVRLVVAMKAASLARGHSGVRWEVIELLRRSPMRASCPAFPRRARSARPAISRRWRISPRC